MTARRRLDGPDARRHSSWRPLLALALLGGSLLWLLAAGRRRFVAVVPRRVPTPRASLVAWSAAVGIAIAAAGGGYLWKAWRADFLREAEIDQETGGVAARAIPAMIENGCGGCHEIPGVPGAHGTVGPSLDGVARRTYIGGRIRTSPEAMIRWISRARDVDPDTAMPNTALSPREARDIAAYLYART